MQYRGLTLDPFQQQAIEALSAGDSVLVAAPTGTGKTVVADWMVEETLASGHEVIYTAPIKALSNQKFRDYCKLLGEDKVGLVTGDLVIRRDAPCRVMTTEILRNMLLGGEALPHLRAVIVDEIHFLDDPDRGTVWEEVLIYLHSRVQIVGLSATLSNLDDFSEWLSHVRERSFRVVEEHKRAVPLSFAIATREGGLLSPPEMDGFYKNWERRNRDALQLAEKQKRKHRGRRRGPPQRTVGARTNHIDVFDALWPDLMPYLFFVFSRRDTESLARGLVRKLDGPLLKREEYEVVKARVEEFRKEPGAEAAMDDELAQMLRGGVAFHHAGLHVMLKALVEELYERRLIRVLYCTGTFALGLNMPARAAVFDGLMRYNGKEMIDLPGREFMQMAGRAGRRGMDDHGLVVMRTDIEAWPEMRPQLKQYLQGDLEPVRSRFSLSFNSVVNLLERHDEERIRQLVERSFLAWGRAKEQAADEERIEELRQKLATHGWTPDSKAGAPKEFKHEVKRLKRAERRAKEAGDKTWSEFQEKVLFLQKWGYIDEDDNFNAGATALKHVQISEIFVTEVILEGVFDELDMPTLFGVFCGMCATLPRGTFAPEAKRWRDISRRIDKIRNSEIVLEAEKLTGQEITWDGGMIPFGRWWAEGQTLPELIEKVQSTSDASGDLVGAFRRAKDLASQVRGAWGDLPEKCRELDALVRSVTRDEVEVVD